VRRLLLVRFDAATENDTAEAERWGALVRTVAVDPRDGAALEALVAGIDPAHPLTGVVHVAGLSAAVGPVGGWAAAADALTALDRATRAMPATGFVTLSDGAAAWDGPVHPERAAAAAFAEALTAARRSAGLPGLAVSFGPWAAAGQDPGPDVRGPWTRILGTDRGLALLGDAYRTDAPALLAADIRTGGAAHPVPAALRALAARAVRTAPVRPVAAAPEPAVPAPGWAGRLAGLPPAERRRTVVGLVRDHAAAVLGRTDSGALRVDVSFKELGFDSMTAVELRNRLVADSGLRLPAAVVFRHPTPEQLARRIEEQLAPDTPDPEPKAAPPGGPGGGDRATPGAAAADRLASASAAELLDFIDNELGVLSEVRPHPSH
jgi:polyketide synthase 12